MEAECLHHPISIEQAPFAQSVPVEQPRTDTVERSTQILGKPPFHPGLVVVLFPQRGGKPQIWPVRIAELGKHLFPKGGARCTPGQHQGSDSSAGKM